MSKEPQDPIDQEDIEDGEELKRRGLMDSLVPKMVNE